MSAAAAGRRQNALKLHCLKRPKTVSKDEIWTRKQIIQNLIYGVYLLISDVLVRRLKANKN